MGPAGGSGHIPRWDETDWYTPDEHLRWLARRSLGEALWPVAEGALAQAGRMVPLDVEPLVREADRHPPRLLRYDATGARIDQIEFHPAYGDLIRTVLGFGVVRGAYSPGWRGLTGRAPRPLVTAVLYLFLQADQAVTGCPVGMMDAMARCLERNDAQLAQRFVPRLADDGGRHLTAAMFLTEKSGGSDVGANETRAVATGDGMWALHGEKWFASCPHSDLVLITARPEGAPSGSAGIGLFLMPRHLDEGTRNLFVIHRLKDKFGTRAMPSGEVGLRGALAWPVGRLDRGMRQVMDMVSLTRVGIVAATAGSMRRSATEALSYAGLRRSFDRPLDSHPLMLDTLAELVVDATAGLSAAMCVAETLDRADRGDVEAGEALRLLTPLLKLHGTERARVCATEAMEARGGNGYIEDWPDARLLRDVYVHAIWEGSGNIIALDALRALERGAAGGLLAQLERDARIAASGPGTAPAGAFLLQGLEGLSIELESWRMSGEDRGRRLGLRRMARRLAMITVGTRLAAEAAAHATGTGSGRLVWLAARYLARLAGTGEIADDSTWLGYSGNLLRGGPVPLDLGAAAMGKLAAAMAGMPLLGSPGPPAASGVARGI